MELLRTQTIYWSNPLDFNDPFDCQFNPLAACIGPAFKQIARQHIHSWLTGPIDWDRFNDARWRTKVGEWRLRALRSEFEAKKAVDFFTEALTNSITGPLPRSHAHFREHVRSLRILCLSAPHNNLLLWSHYGDSHRGCVIGFSVEALKQAWAHTIRPSSLLKVSYAPSIPIIFDPAKLVVSALYQEELEPEPSAGVAMIATKAITWDYEVEWRFYRRADDGESSTQSIQFPPEAVFTVGIGCCCDPIHAAAIRDAASRLPNARVCKYKQSDTEFGLEIE